MKFVHTKTLIILVTAVFLTSCNFFTESEDPILHDQPTIKQGVYGFVKFWEGDFMPSPDGSSGTITPVARQVFIYELTNWKEVEEVGYSPFYRKINSELITSKSSNDKGFFEFELPEGNYSMFVKENAFFYANILDGSGNIFPFTVKKDSLTIIQFDITYKASY